MKTLSNDFPVGRLVADNSRSIEEKEKQCTETMHCLDSSLLAYTCILNLIYIPNVSGDSTSLK